MSGCTKAGSDPFCCPMGLNITTPEGQKLHTPNGCPLGDVPIKNTLSSFILSAAPFDYLAHSKECEEIRWMTSCKGKVTVFRSEK